MIEENIAAIRARLHDGCKLLAVSKLKSTDDIMQAYNCGQRLFGENYPLELRDKHAALPTDIEWHFIGHLQAKQLKYYIPFVAMIHGVDSVDHLMAVEQAAAKVGRSVDVLLQYHIATEATKAGFLLGEAPTADTIAALNHVRVRGVMGMASNTPDSTQVRAEFDALHQQFDSLKQTLFANAEWFDQLSMGMSNDWPVAVEAGSTLVRVGSGIFGQRDYSKGSVLRNGGVDDSKTKE